MHMATKLDRVGITLFYKVMWKIRSVISLLPEGPMTTRIIKAVSYYEKLAPVKLQTFKHMLTLGLVMN